MTIDSISSSNAEKNVRIGWVDAAKAFGLLLVFWGHLLYGGSHYSEVINKIIYSFHMPMYFILSGYVCKSDTKTLMEYIKGKFKRILLPAIILYLCTLPLFFYYTDYSTTTLLSMCVSIFYITGGCAYNDPVWFFFCMFEILVIAKFLKLPDLSVKNLLIIMILSLSCSYAFYKSGSTFFYLLGFNKCVLGLFFYSFGILLHRINYSRVIIPLGLLSIPIWLVFGAFLNDKVTMYGMKLGNFWFFIISSIAGSLSFFLFSKLFERYKWVLQYAKWTVFIVCSHYVFVTLFRNISSILGFEHTVIYDIASAFYFIAIFSFYYIICRILEKKSPVLIGK